MRLRSEIVCSGEVPSGGRSERSAKSLNLSTASRVRGQTFARIRASTRNSEAIAGVEESRISLGWIIRAPVGSAYVVSSTGGRSVSF